MTMASQRPPTASGVRTTRRNTRQDTHLTSGLGWGDGKKQQLNSFWNIVWPKLTVIGWRQVKGEGGDDGSVFFLPPGIDYKTAERGVDFYDRIKDVIDRVQERRNDEEASVADLYAAETEQLGEYESDSDNVLPNVRGRRSAAQQSEDVSTEEDDAVEIDLSWKDGGASFPIKSSRLGDEYQAIDIPPAGSYTIVPPEDADQEESILFDQVWDPKKASEAGMNDYVHTTIPANKKEAGMVALHEQAYKPDRLDGILLRCPAQDGTDWTNSQKDRFRTEIFRLRKDIGKVAKSMNKSVTKCMTYYLGSFKKSDDYRLLKTVCAEERVEKQAQYDRQGLDACAICGDGGSLLICDGCEREYHMTCVNPPLATVPDGHWECDDCVNTSFYRARDRLIRCTGAFEKIDQNTRKRKLHETNGTEGKEFLSERANEEIMLRPAPHVLAAVKQLAASISAVLQVPATAHPSESGE